MGNDLPEKLSQDFILDRNKVIPELVGNPDDFLFIGGLAGSSKDIANLTNDGANIFTMGGAMGGASMIGLGLALAQPQKRVLVFTGDGELLMNLGSLAVIGVQQPKNLCVVCVDNGHYSETGNQLSHTSFGVRLDKIAENSNICTVRTIETEADIARYRSVLRDGVGPVFILLRVKDGNPPRMKRNSFAWLVRDRFRTALLKS